MFQLAVANSKQPPHLAPSGASVVGAVVHAPGRQGITGQNSSTRWLESLYFALLNNLLTFQGNPRVQIYENQVPKKSMHMYKYTAAGKKRVITLKYLHSLDLNPNLILLIKVMFLNLTWWQFISLRIRQQLSLRSSLLDAMWTHQDSKKKATQGCFPCPLATVFFSTQQAHYIVSLQSEIQLPQWL